MKEGEFGKEFEQPGGTLMDVCTDELAVLIGQAGEAQAAIELVELGVFAGPDDAGGGIDDLFVIVEQDAGLDDFAGEEFGGKADTKAVFAEVDGPGGGQSGTVGTGEFDTKSSNYAGYHGHRRWLS